MLRNKILPSLPTVFDRPSSLRMSRDFVSGKLIISVRYLVQRRTTSSRSRGERHGLRVTCHPPTERVWYFFSPGGLHLHGGVTISKK